MWENFGPMHVDRCVAVVDHFQKKRRVIGIELGKVSDTYDWIAESSPYFVKHTLFPESSIVGISGMKVFWRLLRIIIAIGPADFFLCRYERPETFLLSVLLRLLGRRVFCMNDSKYDDKPRNVRREALKSFFFLPYNGALVAGKRSAEYLRFLHFHKRIEYGYDAISIRRIREQAGSPLAPDGETFKTRHFTVVARLVAKKNLFVLLEAFSRYVRRAESPRFMHLCGSGPLEKELKRRAIELGVDHCIVFHGFVSTAGISRILAETLALLLVSTEEQYGLVIPEALAMGVPVIISTNCGARDELVRAGMNGFVVEPDNPLGMAFFMELIDKDEELWRSLATCAKDKAIDADVSRFAMACEALMLEGRSGGI